MDFITIGNVKIEKTCALSPMATRRQTFPAGFKTAAASVIGSEAYRLRADDPNFDINCRHLFL